MSTDFEEYAFESKAEIRAFMARLTVKAAKDLLPGDRFQDYTEWREVAGPVRIKGDDAIVVIRGGVVVLPKDNTFIVDPKEGRDG